MSGARLKSIKITATGNGTFTVPAGVTWLIVTAGGGGGGGSGGVVVNVNACGSGGGGSGLQTRIIHVIPGATYNYFVGAGGNVAGGFDNGGDGQPTSFGSEIFWGGGGATSYSFIPTVGYKKGSGNNTGASGGSNLYNRAGSSSFYAMGPTGVSNGGGGVGTNNGSNIGGSGGGAGFGAGAAGGNAGGTTGADGAAAGNNTGGGGGGGGVATSTPGGGGAGGSGLLIIGWFVR